MLLFSQLLNSPFQAALDLGRTILQDIYEVTILAWRQTINLGPFSRQERMILVGVITMIILAAIFVFIYLFKLRPEGDRQQKDEHGNSNRWAIQTILVGLFALLRRPSRQEPPTPPPPVPHVEPAPFVDEKEKREAETKEEPIEAAEPPGDIEQPPSESGTCPYCGREVQPDWSHCAYCGAGLGE